MARQEIIDNLDQVSGGNIQIKDTRVRNTTDGSIYNIATDNVTPNQLATWVYNNYGAYADDAAIISALYSKGWLL